jgi:hypothetical protein
MDAIFLNAIVTLSHCIYLMQSLHHTLLDLCEYPMMQSSLWQMMHTRTSEDPILDNPEISTGRGRGQAPCGNAPPPPPHPPISLEQLLATQEDLMRRLVENDECRGAEHQQPRHQARDSSYSDSLEAHTPVCANATDPMEADSWLCTMECKFRLLHKLCTLHNNYEAQLEPGGLLTPPPYLLIITSHGVSFAQPSVPITYLRVCSAPS